jgi:hypothetical protein
MTVRLSHLRAGRLLLLVRFVVLISVDPRAIVRLEGSGQLKRPMISSRIEVVLFAKYNYNDQVKEDEV